MNQDIHLEHLWLSPYLIKQECCGGASECELLGKWKMVAFTTQQRKSSNPLFTSAKSQGVSGVSTPNFDAQLPGISVTFLFPTQWLMA